MESIVVAAGLANLSSATTAVAMNFTTSGSAASVSLTVHPLAFLQRHERCTRGALKNVAFAKIGLPHWAQDPVSFQSPM